MTKQRVEAFSDGVIAILITIMVLELRTPAASTFAALRPLAPTFFAYVLSFVYLGIYWNTHHHMLQAARRVNGAVLWANLHLLFWLSLVPFVTAWLGADVTATPPAALYGVVLLMAGCAFTVLQTAIIRVDGEASPLAHAIGRDSKGKLSIICYASATGLAFVRPWLSEAVYVFVALLWLVPDRRMERAAESE